MRTFFSSRITHDIDCSSQTTCQQCKFACGPTCLIVIGDALALLYSSALSCPQYVQCPTVCPSKFGPSRPYASEGLSTSVEYKQLIKCRATGSAGRFLQQSIARFIIVSANYKLFITRRPVVEAELCGTSSSHSDASGARNDIVPIFALGMEPIGADRLWRYVFSLAWVPPMRDTQCFSPGTHAVWLIARESKARLGQD
jgi:hypothetical protein